MVAPERLLGSRGAALLAREGEKVGTIEEVYLDRETKRPEWALVDTGMFGTRFTFVPLSGATVRGRLLQVPLGKDRIKGAPNIEPEHELSRREEADLYAYYGLKYSAYRSGGSGTEASSRRTPAAHAFEDNPTTDDAIPRPVEDLRVARTRRGRGEVRLEKHAVTENDAPIVPRSRLGPGSNNFRERHRLSERIPREADEQEDDIHKG